MDIKQITEAPYTAKVKLKDPDGNEEEIRVLYRPLTLTLMGQFDASIKDEKMTAEDQAVLLIKELPDLTSEGQPVTVDRALFEAMDARHVAAMVGAVVDHYRGLEEIPAPEKQSESETQQAAQV